MWRRTDNYRNRGDFGEMLMIKQIRRKNFKNCLEIQIYFKKINESYKKYPQSPANRKDSLLLCCIKTILSLSKASSEWDLRVGCVLECLCLHKLSSN